MKKSLFKKKTKKDNGDMALQITSMADIFIIILVFMLKSFSTGSLNITPSAGMKLPESRESKTEIIEALKVELSETSVQLEGKPIVSLNQFNFNKSDLKKNGTSITLANAIQKERKRQLIIAKSNSEVKLDPKIIVIADQRTPYQSIKTVLASAAIHGYTDFKLAVVKGD